MHFQTSFICIPMISEKKTCWALTRSRPRFHTSLPRCVPEGHMQGKEVGKLWVSLCWWTWRTWVRKHEEYECSFTTCYYKIWDFHATSLKTWTWVPVLEVLAEINTKTWFSMQASGSKQDFFFKNVWTLFSLSKISFKLMHDVQNRFDHAMQLDKHKEQQE